jgi:hypothetical protein
MTHSLADPDDQAEVEAALGEPVTALYYALAIIVDEAAGVAESASPPDADTLSAWREHAARVRYTLGLTRAAYAGMRP